TQTYANDARFSELDGMLTLRYSGRRGSIGGSAGYLRSYFVNVDRGSFYMNANFNASYRNVSVNGTAWYQRYSFTPLSTMRHYAPESEVTFNWRLSAAVTLQAGMRYFLGGLKTELHQEDRGYRTDSTQEMLDRKYLVLAGLNINLRNRAPKSRMEKRLYQDESGIQLK
ncbi:MAG: hypothetical protein LBK07_06435, partial [Tannerella sp.]|nr:hypothetical protein [Tannerella sp.]